MTLKTKITLITIAAVLAAVIVTAAACAIYANSKKDKSLPVAFLSDWMAAINDSTLLKNVAIPGAHDAGTAGMPYFAGTQDKTITEMLQSGTRYLDLRVEKKDGELFVFHGIVRGQKLENILKEVAAFLRAHNQEVVILDFQHFKGQSQNDIVALVEKYLSSYTLKNNGTNVIGKDFIDRLLIRNARGKCIIFWGSDSDTNLNKNFVFKRNDDLGNRTNSALHSFYVKSLNKKSSSVYVQRALPSYIEMYKQKDYGMFVLQGQLTDGLLIFGPRLRERSHTDNMNAYTQELLKSTDLKYINIVMRDFVDPVKNSYILELNMAKGIVKSASVEAYRSALANFIEVKADNMDM